MLLSAILHMDNHQVVNEKEVQVLVFGNNALWIWPLPLEWEAASGSLCAPSPEPRSASLPGLWGQR